jgi:membrane-bound lytic murein transglycosylase B
MRIMKSHRETICKYCGNIINVGEIRLTDTLVIGPGKQLYNGEAAATKPRYIRIHFHQARQDQDVSCYELFAQKQADYLASHEDAVVISNNPKGRPKSNLTDDQRIRRNRLLQRLRQQIHYYMTEKKLDLSPRSISYITQQDVKQAQRFKNNLENLIKELEEVGGVPEGYRLDYIDILQEASIG